MSVIDYTEAADGLGAADLVREGREHDLAGRQFEAMNCYATAVDLAKEAGQRSVLAEALRRLGVLHHTRAEPEVAAELCERSYQEAIAAEAHELAAEALNALAGFDLERGRMDQARERYRMALDLAGADAALAGKIEQNLGILASMQGSWAQALDHYERSLRACGAAGDQRGCAIGYHNMGRIRAEQKQWAEAATHFRDSLHLAGLAADCHLIGLAYLSQAELHLALARYEAAKDCAEAALHAFASMDARRDRAGAHRVLGSVFREMNRPSLAESHLRAALETAVGTACPLEEADSSRELAILYQRQGRRLDSVKLLERARGLFGTLNAPHEVADLDERLLELQGT
jgi:tetratricopeptide (TPR) repeat protein